MKTRSEETKEAADLFSQYARFHRQLLRRFVVVDPYMAQEALRWLDDLEKLQAAHKALKAACQEMVEGVGPDSWGTTVTQTRHVEAIRALVED